ncbi:MAG: HDIG domain-containing metalloprotein [Mycoplasmoidaceae bacterium]
MNAPSFELNALGIILLILFLFTLIILIIFIFYLFTLNKDQTNYKKESEYLDQLNKTLDHWTKLNEDLQLQIDNYVNKTLKVNGLSKNELKDILLLDVDAFYKKDVSKRIEYWKTQSDDEVKKISSQILVDSMEPLIPDLMAKTFSKVNFPESRKKMIIGKEGKHIREIESLTKATLNIENNNQIIVSSFSPIKREVAIRTLRNIINAERITIDKIHMAFHEEEAKFNKELIEIGRSTVEDKLHLTKYLIPDMYYYIGRLRYRTSYNQNNLIHALECARIATSIASDVGVDEDLAKLCAFIHDIGKAVDFEENYDHVESGIELAKKFHLHQYAINAIESHHNKVPPDNIYATIAKIADIISASRPGVRFINKDDSFYKRIELIEKICRGFKGVENAHAIKNGRVVHIIINPKIIKEDSMHLLASEIKQKLQKEASLSSRQISLHFTPDSMNKPIPNYKKSN